MGVFVSCLKAISSEEEKGTLSAAFTRCTVAIYVKKQCKNWPKGERIGTEYIVLNRAASEVTSNATKSLLQNILGRG